MTSVRGHLRLWVAAWLVFQVASLSALVPRDCCAAHRPATSGSSGCHEDAQATECPMRSADGTACPMHRSGDAAEGERSGNSCSLKGSCDGPMAALFVLLSNYGVLADRIAMLPDSGTQLVATPARESMIRCLASPDSPPPRA